MTLQSLRTSAWILSALAATSAWAVTEGAPTLPHAGSRPGRVIDFEDGVVEAMNQRPLDSVTQTSESDKKRRKKHLYRLRAGFGTEVEETLKQARYK